MPAAGSLVTVCAPAAVCSDPRHDRDPHLPYPGLVRILRSKSAERAKPDNTKPDNTSEATTEAAAAGRNSGKATTAGKGRPTPKRRDAEGRRRGPVPPPPRTQREAMKRARGNKEERRRAA